MKLKDMPGFPSLLASGEELHRDRFPELSHMSSAFIYRFVPIPKTKLPPEFVYVPGIGSHSKSYLELRVGAASWNTFWEAGHLRHNMFNRKTEKVPESLKKYKGHNIYLLPAESSWKYEAHEPLYHLLPLKTLKQFGLPPFRRGRWPFTVALNHGEYLPKGFGSSFP